MQHPDEGTIHAWLDGQLPGPEAAALETHLAGCAQCSATVAEARGLVAASSRIVSALDGVPSGVLPASAPRQKRAWYVSTQFRAAAVLAVVAGTSLLLVEQVNPPVPETDGIETVAPMTQQSSATDAIVAPAPAAQPQIQQATSPARVSPAISPSPSTANATRAAESRLERTRIAPPSVRAEADFTGKSVAQPAPAAGAAGATQQRALASSPATDVVVTGVASMAAPVLRLVSEDSTGLARTSVYEVDPGKLVTLTSAPVPGRPAGATSMRAAHPMAAIGAAIGETAHTVITWDADGKRFTLSGQFTLEELELIRRRLPPTRP